MLHPSTSYRRPHQFFFFCAATALLDLLKAAILLCQPTLYSAATAAAAAAAAFPTTIHPTQLLQTPLPPTLFFSSARPHSCRRLYSLPSSSLSVFFFSLFFPQFTVHTHILASHTKPPPALSILSSTRRPLPKPEPDDISLKLFLLLHCFQFHPPNLPRC